MSDPLLALQGAIVATLNGDAALVALLGGEKTFEHAPPGTTHPWIAFEEMRSTTADVSGYATREHRIALLCVSRQPGTREALAIASRVQALLHDATLPLDGHRLINLAVSSVDIMRAAREPLRKARVSLRAVTETI
ncbi:MAG: hypothetical protein BGP06_15255 [Rhizobiales bacterium 65-9]|nr:DUF3168 domain-containing protein [Hyphomicrobiales bacterium]OJY37855.1 MAG: hypothetical protein BGP06_15255 [Rhizobiales bacterium 65-9]